MRTKKNILVGAILCLITILVIGYYWYQKPRQSLADVAPHYTLSASALYNAFNSNEAAANNKYLDKILLVTGSIAAVEISDSTVHLLLKATEAGGVNCTLRGQSHSTDALPEQGEPVKVKGKCIGFLMDVNLVDAVIVNDVNK